MNKKLLIGSWKIETGDRLSEQSFVSCITVMSFGDELCKRECVTTKTVNESDGAVVKYVIPVTLIGYYDLKGDVLTMRDFSVGLGSPNVSIDTSKCDEQAKEYYKSERAKRLMETGLKINVGEVMRNRGNECARRNNGYPICHIRIENDRLYQKWEGYDAEEVMEKANELNYKIIAGPMNAVQAINFPQVNMIKAFINADLEYIQKVYFILPCETNNDGKEASFKFVPMNVDGKLYIPAFTDFDKFQQSELTNEKTGYKHAQLDEIYDLLRMTRCHALCINPIDGHAVLSLQTEWIEAMLDGRWGGIDENKQIVNREKAN